MAAHPVTHAPTMTEAEYLSAAFEVSPDFVDGHLEERHVGTIDHANWQMAIARWFLQNTSLVPMNEVHIMVAGGRYRIPDVAIFSRLPSGLYVTEAPLAVFEVLSPSDSYALLKERMRDYHRMGVKNLFVIENRNEFSQFRDDRFNPVLTATSDLEGSSVSIPWQGVADLLWPTEPSDFTDPA